MISSFNSHVDIVHVIGSLAAGGAERFVIDLLIELKKQGLSVGLLVLSAKQDQSGLKMSQSLTTEGIPYECGPTERVRFRSLLWYFSAVNRIRPKFVHLHTENTELAHFLACKLYKRKHHLIRTIHNTDIHPSRLRWMAIHGNSVDLSIACSDAVRNKHSSTIKGKIKTIRNGIKFDWPVQTDLLREQYQKRLQLRNDRYHFLHVGRQSGDSLATAQKGHDVLISAWQKGRLHDQGCQLHLLGDGNLRKQLEQLADNDESIIFHGIRDDVHDWLLAADCYLMPSRYEGLPIAGIEAVGTGLPCIFSDIAPLHELRSPAVLWSAVDDVDQLAGNLKEMVTLKMKAPAEATENTRTQFGIEKTAALYYSCYQNISKIHL